MKKLIAEIVSLASLIVERVGQWRRARRERKRRAKEAEYRDKLRRLSGK
jgi:hypothetical protein